ncbi:MAG: phosphotransferase family protein [Caulobacterales bacterium]|nr:phosphotransferase family protein [Caulobacterales bacterium]
MSVPFETARLCAYLDGKLEGFTGEATLKKFAGGQSNPTYLLTSGERSYVLRRKPSGDLLPSAHAVEREYAALKALAGGPVPVATPYLLCTDEDVIGAVFYVMSYEDGRIFWDPALPELERGERRPLFDEAVRVLAAIHDVDVAAAGLSDFGKPGNYFQRQFTRWERQYRASETETVASVDDLIAWLSDHLPSSDESSLIHGDFRIDNIIFEPAAPAAKAVLDWELSTLGHPIADLAYFCMCLRLPREGAVRGLMGLDAVEHGLPREEEIVRHYCALRGWEEVADWPAYLAFSFFRLAAIVQGVHKRALSGNASNANASGVGRMVGPLARMALDVIEHEG